MPLCIFSCRICCPTNDRSPFRNVLRNDRSLVVGSSCPRTTAQRDFVQVATSRTEEGNGGFLFGSDLDGKSIRQGKGVLTLFCCTADDEQRIKAHLQQVFRSFSRYHEALA